MPIDAERGSYADAEDFDDPVVFFAVVPDTFMGDIPARRADRPSLAFADEGQVYPAADRWSF